MINKKQKAFTLVELIVVITILAILGTIAFISLQGYSSQSRDSTRISDLATMKISLELFQLDAGKYPLPTDGVDVTYSGATVWNQGTFGENTFKNVEKLDKIPTDPLTNSIYTYSVTSIRNRFEISGVLEGEVSQKPNVLGETFAGETEGTAFVTGTYNGQMTKSLSGVLCNVLSIPSIIANDVDTSTDLVDISVAKAFVRHGYNNLPASYKSSKFKVNGGFDFEPQQLVAYTDTGSCANLTSGETAGSSARAELLLGLQNSYSGTVLKNDAEIARIIGLVIDVNNPSEAVESFGGSFVNNNLGGSLAVTSSISSPSTSSSGGNGGGSTYDCGTKNGDPVCCFEDALNLPATTNFKFGDGGGIGTGDFCVFGPPDA